MILCNMLKKKKYNISRIEDNFIEMGKSAAQIIKNYIKIEDKQLTSLKSYRVGYHQ